ncbi:MAG TPA: hypothetical protein VFK14_11740 [Solirubrobacterales bacterium]|nr:hypothetical protein [Solirubrobacterales bacterium]
MSGTLLRTLPAPALLALLALAMLAPGDAAAECSGGRGVVVCLGGSISPQVLPRHRLVPISLRLEGTIGAQGGTPPRLQRFDLAFGARGGLDTAGLPVCPRARLRNSTHRQALARCGRALVGRGTIAAEVPLNPAEPILAHAQALAFNGRAHGRPAVWVQAYSPSPPVSFVLPFYLSHPRAGAFGVQLRAPTASALGRWPRLRSFRLHLGRRYRAGGQARSYLSASCPLPPRFHVFRVPLARATYEFDSGPTLSTTILRGCRVGE